MANVIWTPQPRQAALMARFEDEALYGGAAGGGKSDCALAEALRFADAESMEQGIALLEEAFRAAVQQGVEERLLLSAPKVIPVRPAGELSDAEYYAALAQFH